MDCSIQPANEATLVHDTVNIMTNAYLRNSLIIKCVGSDNMSSSSSVRSTNMDSSLVNPGKRPDFSEISNREKHLLLVMEAKRYGRKVSGDLSNSPGFEEFVKPNKYIRIQRCGCCWVSLKESVFNIYVMDHIYDYVYRMVIASKINVPRDCNTNNTYIKKTSLIVDEAAQIINRPTLDREDIPPKNNGILYSIYEHSELVENRICIIQQKAS